MNEMYGLSAEARSVGRRLAELPRECIDDEVKSFAARRCAEQNGELRTANSERTENERRTTNDKRRTTNDERQTTNDERRTTNDEGRTMKDERRHF